MKHRQSIFAKLATALSLSNDRTAEEMLEQYIKDNKHTTLLERIKAIRNNSYFVPDYNKPKAYADMVISFQETPTSELKPISSETITTYQRPVDFGNDIQGWFDSIHADHLKEISIENKNKKTEAFEQMMNERYVNVNKFFNRMLRVD
jgi:hypothetical protein